MSFLKPCEAEINFDSPNREYAHQSIHDGADVILGRGAYGIVVRGNYKQRKVAVKILDKSNSTKYHSLLLEANIQNLCHENIIRILKIVDCTTYGAIIMERFEGKCLQHCLDRFRVDLVHRLHVMSDISSALVFCHENKIVHLDLKPQNVFVAVQSTTVNGRAYVCKLFDFGCSLKLVDMDSYEDGSYENVGGTVRYSAPEVLLGQKPDCLADIFSLAIIMWQLKENKIPYGSIRANETILWNVVKRDMRPDSVGIINNLRDEPNVVKRSHINCKSESSFLQLKKFISSPLTPRSYNRSIQKIPKIFLNKSVKMVEKPLHGTHQKSCISKNRKQLLIRRKLFDAKLSSSLEIDGFDGSEQDSDIDMRNLFVDTQLYLRSPEQILFAENDYDRTYRDCWNRDKKHRYKAIEVQDILKKLLNSLRFLFDQNLVMEIKS